MVAIVNILHVDDDNDFLDLTQSFLNELDSSIQITKITLPEKAIHEILNGSYDVIVSDYQFNGTTGINIFDKLKEKGNNTPFIILTGKGREEIVIKALNRGIDYYLQKGEPEIVFVQLLHFIRIIISKKKAEMALEETKRKFRNIFETLPDPAFVWEKHDGRIILTDVNKATSNFSQRPITRLVNRNLNRLSPDNQSVFSSLKKVMDTGESIQEERVVTIPESPDGSYFRIYYSKPTENSVLTITKDITAEKELEHRTGMEQLITSLSTKLINLSSDQIDKGINNALERIAKFAGVERCYVFQFNETMTAAINTHEWCDDGIETRLDIFSNLILENFSWAMDKLLNNEIIHVPDIRELPSNADSIIQELEQFDQMIKSFLIVPLMSGDRMIGVLGFDSVYHTKSWQVKDIALLKLAGELITGTLDRARMIKVLRDQKEEAAFLLDVLTHDLNNYLASIKGFVDLSLRKSPSPEIDRFLRKSRSAIARVKTLIWNISVLMKRKLPVTYTLHPVNVHSALMSVKETVNGLYPKKKVKYNIDIGRNISYLSDSLFEHLLLNIITNAVKSDDSDTVEIDISLENKVQNGKSRLIIADHGMGIPIEEREGIFERFNEFKKKGSGSGLGLFIVKTLVDRYGGRIWIESRDENDYRKGTKVIIELQEA
ncbi:MAG: ATP-binding protein [Candidatus Hodarchaeales archaeon]